jgi:hypothetical protein
VTYVLVADDAGRVGAALFAHPASYSFCLFDSKCDSRHSFLSNFGLETDHGI